MENLSEFLYGTESSKKMKLFENRIKELNEKHKEILNGDQVENKFFVNYNAGVNKNMLQITDNELDINISNDINDIFNEIFK